MSRPDGHGPTANGHRWPCTRFYVTANDSYPCTCSAAPAAEADLRAALLTVIPAHPEVDEEDTAAAVLALPALQRLAEQAAEAARLRAVVERVSDALNPDPADYATATDVVYDVRRALDGTDG